jgi:hypothetical protein
MYCFISHSAQLALLPLRKYGSEVQPEYRLFLLSLRGVLIPSEANTALTTSAKRGPWDFNNSSLIINTLHSKADEMVSFVQWLGYGLHSDLVSLVQWLGCGSNPGGGQIFLFTINVHTSSGTHPASYSVVLELSGHGLQLTTHLHLIPRLKMSGALTLHHVGDRNDSTSFTMVRLCRANCGQE